jgi:hypothetical protein
MSSTEGLWCTTGFYKLKYKSISNARQYVNGVFTIDALCQDILGQTRKYYTNFFQSYWLQ